MPFQRYLTNRPQPRRRILQSFHPIAGEVLETRQMLSGNPVADITELSDEFDDSSSISDWQRVNETEGWNADQLQQWDVDQSQPGRMVMQPHTVVWYENWRGPMVFKEVTGDFVFTSQVNIGDRDDLGDSDADDIPDDAAYSLGGIMIRTPRDITDPAADWQPGSQLDDGTNNGENYVFLSMGHGTDGQFSFEVKTTRNSNSQLELTPLGQEANTATLRIARIGDSVITMYQLPGQDWVVHRRFSRSDMPETMQLGLVTYSDWNKANDFDPFTHNSSVLEPGITDPTPAEAFNPDLVVGFDFARFARPEVPAELAGVDLVNAATEEQILSFLGDPTEPVDDIEALSDEFDDPASITDWQRVNETEGWNADQLQAWDVDQTQPGRMVMQPHTVVWYENYRGPMVYKEVSGDFVFTSQVNIGDRDDIGDSDADDIPDDAAYSLGGIMIRTPRDITDPAADWQPGSQLDDGTNNGENYVFLSMGHATDGQFSFEVKSTRNSNSQLALTPLGQEANTATLRIARIGNSVITMYQLPGQDWQVLQRFSRPDMPETMQLGLVTYSDWNKASDFDPFTHNSSVLEPGITDPTPAEAFNPDLVVGFDYARFARPEVPAELAGVDLVNTATDEQLLDFLGENTIPNDNTPPEITPIPNPTLTVGDAPLLIDLMATDADADPLDYSVDLETPLAVQIMADHNLYENVSLENFALNWGGQNEKWIRGDEGWYYLLPDGSLHMWGGSFESSTFLAQLSEAEYNDPHQLLNATEPDLTVEVVGGQLVITPGSQTGVFTAEVTVSDGIATDSTTIQIEIVNTAPIVEIADQQLTTGGELNIPLPATDADGHTVTYSVQVIGDQLASLDNEHGFWHDGNFYTNFLGQNERWIRDADSTWHYILPSGELHRWNGSFESSPLIAELDTEVYDDPSLLTDPEPAPIIAVVNEGVLTISVGEGYSGEVEIQLTAFDGYATAVTTFQVTIISNDDIDAAFSELEDSEIFEF